MSTQRKTSGGALSWPDPLSMGFEAHRRLLLLRLRLHGTAAKRYRHGLLAARRRRSATLTAASATSAGSITSNSQPTFTK